MAKKRRRSSPTNMPTKSEQHEHCSKARDHLDPGPFFRFVTYFYAEQRYFGVLLIHAVCTLII
jgi:hypothetical protein